jgi:hypothetical protein
MISNHLSLIEAHRPDADAIAARVSQFLAKGGEIKKAKPFGYVPRPITYSTKMPPARQQKESEPVPVNEKSALITKIREMAKTMTQTEVTAETGLTRKQLYTISANNGFEFKTALRMDEVAEAALVLRIRECMRKQMTRNKARQHLDISFSLLTRLIKNYDIPYPLAVC